MTSQVLKYGLFVVALIVALLGALGVPLPPLDTQWQQAVEAVAVLIGLLVKLWQNSHPPAPPRQP